MFDIISVGTFWIFLLIVHGLLAVILLGALTHQALSVAAPVRPAVSTSGFITRFRNVRGAGYATAVCVLWVVTFILGAWIYTKYRIAIRIPLERNGYWKTLGFFELKEHATTLGLVILPAYWYFWKNAKNAAYAAARKWTTVLLTSLCWFAFIVGHLLNNARGF
jgi:hypothetical protein